MNSGQRLTLARFLIGCVLFFNVQCAFIFLVLPQSYVSSFELSGAPGQAMVQALGVLFLMWNVPYGVALVQPVRQRMSHLQAIWMQAIGLAGETWLLMGLAEGHEILRATALRFIVFDGLGLLALAASYWLLRHAKPNQSDG